MELLRIRGGRRLEGAVAISGSKNASLPVMAAALLTDQEVELGNVPDIEDISTMARMLEHVGVTVEHPDTNTWRLHAASLSTTEVDPNRNASIRIHVSSPCIKAPANIRAWKPTGTPSPSPSPSQ